MAGRRIAAEGFHALPHQAAAVLAYVISIVQFIENVKIITFPCIEIPCVSESAILKNILSLYSFFNHKQRLYRWMLKNLFQLGIPHLADIAVSLPTDGGDPDAAKQPDSPKEKQLLLMHKSNITVSPCTILKS